MHFLAMWIEKYPEDFLKNLDLDRLKKFMDYVNLNMPFSYLVIRVEDLLSKKEEQESKKATPKDEEACDPEPSSGAVLSGMPETLGPRPTSSLNPQGELEPLEGAVVPEIMAHSVSAAEPTHLLTAALEEDLPTPAHTEPPPDVAVDAPAPGQGFLPATGNLERADHTSSLPEFNLLKLRMTYYVPASTTCRAEVDHPPDRARVQYQNWIISGLILCKKDAVCYIEKSE
ncbi:ral guanine nucleotide dissociation stimulator-like [Nannospalax galili]|uniref:ral guanine nucleotide dissociation stimulator-like n=1 Tax=Nannospalax galili TaxID=1026970 RepID=UPI00111BD78E|nr:ral guanine nucleotide dissociation stimulator-like [Nannospalax galili]